VVLNWVPLKRLIPPMDISGSIITSMIPAAAPKPIKSGSDSLGITSKKNSAADPSSLRADTNPCAVANQTDVRCLCRTGTKRPH